MSELLSRAREIFAKAKFVNDVGIEVVQIREGFCETRLAVESRHLQQTESVHAGVVATMADHTAGGAALTHLRDGQGVLTLEFKVNFLRPALGTELRCRSQVLKSGRTVCFAESEVFAVKDQEETLVSKALVTLAITNPR